MATKRVNVNSMAEVSVRIKALGKNMPKKIVKAMQNTARRGHSDIMATIHSTKPSPMATQTYKRAWKVTKTKTGAILGNTAYHSIFVEVGRRPGKMPPIKPIIEWMYAKKIVRRIKFRQLKTRRAQLSRKSKIGAIMNTAFLIRRKIAQKGIKGRHVLGRTMPSIRKMLRWQLRIAIRDQAKYKPSGSPSYKGLYARGRKK